MAGLIRQSRHNLRGAEGRWDGATKQGHRERKKPQILPQTTKLLLAQILNHRLLKLICEITRLGREGIDGSQASSTAHVERVYYFYLELTTLASKMSMFKIRSILHGHKIP